jgi:hypothetical protein
MYIGWGGERRIQGFGRKNSGKEPTGETQAYGRIILRWIFNK